MLNGSKFGTPIVTNSLTVKAAETVQTRRAMQGIFLPSVSNIDLHLLHTVGFYGPCQNPFVTKVART